MLLALHLCVTLTLALGVLVAAVVHRDVVRQHWSTGLALSALVLLLGAPMQVTSVMHLDVFAVLDSTDVHPSVLENAASGLAWAAVIGTVIASGLGLLYRVLLVPVAIAADPERPPFPLLTGHPGAFGGWWFAIPMGGGLGLVSAVALWLFGVSTSELVGGRAAWFPGLDLGATGSILALVLPQRLAAALSEELLFRGVLQRWIGRGLGGSVVAAGVAIAVTSAVWATGRAGATDHALLEFVQMTVFGGFLGATAHRWGVEASIVAHATFAVVAVLVALASGA